MLDRDRAEVMANVGGELRAEFQPLVLLSGCLVVSAYLAERRRPSLDRESHVGVVGLEEVRSDGVADLVAGDSYEVTLRVGDREREACLDVAHRLTDVLPIEAVAALFEGIQQGER